MTMTIRQSEPSLGNISIFTAYLAYKFIQIINRHENEIVTLNIFCIKRLYLILLIKKIVAFHI